MLHNIPVNICETPSPALMADVERLERTVRSGLVNRNQYEALSKIYEILDMPPVVALDVAQIVEWTKSAVISNLPEYV